VQNLLVSIITISYNSEEHIEETLRNVVRQDYKDLEYIVIDGGSTDGTLGIIEKYRDKISKLVSEPDEGISDAMNKGIRMASGDIIGIIHSDDYYADPTVIRKVADLFIKSPEIKAVYGIQDVIDPVMGKVLLTWGRDEEPSEIRKRMYIPHPTLFLRREVYEEIGLFRTDYRIAMDYEFALRLTRYTRPYFLNYKIACLRDMGASGRHWKQGFREVVRALLEHGYYFSAATMAFRNAVKTVLISLGMKGLIYRLWEKNVSPR
jgi:glycosyltransferase involved in cell wall biosynthesis